MCRLEEARDGPQAPQHLQGLVLDDGGRVRQLLYLSDLLGLRPRVEGVAHDLPVLRHQEFRVIFSPTIVLFCGGPSWAYRQRTEHPPGISSNRPKQILFTS